MVNLNPQVYWGCLYYQPVFLAWMIFKHIQRIFVKKKEYPNSPDYQRRRRRRRSHISTTGSKMWLNLLVDDGQSVWLQHKIENKNPICPNIINYTAEEERDESSSSSKCSISLVKYKPPRSFLSQEGGRNLPV
jgi:hypothetical protein